MRLDKYLIWSKLFDSRNKAQEAIKNNLVKVNDKIINYPNYQIKSKDEIILINHDQYVSRGAYKLLTAISSFNINFENKIILDLGSSTGGFSQVALKQNAKKVYCVDVGKNQLHRLIRNNPKVISYEETDLRDLNKDMIKQQIDFVISDLSFISITCIFEKLNELFNYSFQLVLLIKPQYELNKDIIKKYKGIINDVKLQNLAINKVITYAKKLDYKTINVVPSNIKGKEGNQEYLVHMIKENK